MNRQPGVAESMAAPAGTPWSLQAQAEKLAEKPAEAMEEKLAPQHNNTHSVSSSDGDGNTTLARNSISEHHDLDKSEEQRVQEEQKETITGLAQSLSRVPTTGVRHDEHGVPVNPFHGSDDPLLDPASGQFSSRAWTKQLMGITSRDPERYPRRTAGIAYRNLGAYGFGEPTDYQKTYGNFPLGLGNVFRKLIGQSKKTRIQILRDFDGLVRSGEMLVVLGRPGRYVTGSVTMVILLILRL